MTVKEMFNELEDKERDTIIVTLKYKYDFEENYTIENHILEYDSMSDSYVWLNDWNEGQTDVEVLGYMPLGNVDTTKIEPCEDCISREEAIRIASINSMPVNECVSLIRELPSVTPEIPKGKWIDDSKEDSYYANCSHCDYQIDTHYERGYLNYCPNCGTKMEVEE